MVWRGGDGDVGQGGTWFGGRAKVGKHADGWAVRKEEGWNGCMGWFGLDGDGDGRFLLGLRSRTWK